MARSTDNRWLHRFALLTTLSTLVLIGAGGLVTSHGAGMSVPDWPTTYGYNMFLFPISQWVGAIFYEHSHRLIGSIVGALTTILAVWLWIKDSRPWLRWLGALAFILVVVQGVLGGLRVTLFKDELGIFHATLAQLFFLLVGAITLFTSPRWESRWRTALDSRRLAGLQWLFILASGLIFLQLMIGATMRHQHAGLAVPDFPLAYGAFYPPTDPEFLHRVNAGRIEARDFNEITAFQVHLHMGHRFTALGIFVLVFVCALQARRVLGPGTVMTRLATLWFGLICLQAILGAWTVWSNKAADIATAHVVIGAVSLLTGGLLSIVLRANVLRQARNGRVGEVCLPPGASVAPNLS